jgi:Fic family protein
LIGESKGRQALYARQSPELLESLRTVAAIESTESSNRIEGITAPKNRIREIVLKSTAPRTRSEQEIAGYRDALQLIHESHPEIRFTVGVVKQLHTTLYRYLPTPGGDFKMADNEIIQRHPSGEVTVRFKALSAAATPGAVQSLVEEYGTAVRHGRSGARPFGCGAPQCAGLPAHSSIYRRQRARCQTIDLAAALPCRLRRRPLH